MDGVTRRFPSSFCFRCELLPDVLSIRITYEVIGNRSGQGEWSWNHTPFRTSPFCIPYFRPRIELNSIGQAFCDPFANRGIRSAREDSINMDIREFERQPFHKFNETISFVSLESNNFSYLELNFSSKSISTLFKLMIQQTDDTSNN